MNKTIEQLEAEKAELEKRLAQEQHKIQRYENRITYYEKGERQKRAHRLITRGAAVESIVPEVRGMGETDFYTLMEKIFSMPEARAAVRAAVQMEDR